MRRMQVVLAALVLAFGTDCVVAATKPTAAQAKRIKELIEEIRNADYTGWDFLKRKKGDDPTEAGEELCEMGAAAIPSMVVALQLNKYPFNAKVYLVCILGQLAGEEVPTATPALCKLLELWSTNARWAKDNEAQDFEGRSGNTFYYSVMKRSLLPACAAHALFTVANPRSVPSLTKTMANLRQNGDRNYSTEPRDRKAGEFSIEVMRVAAHALAAIDDDTARKYIDKAETSPSMSLRVTCTIAKAARMLKDDPKVAAQLLRDKCDVEKNPIILEEYKRFILDNCKGFGIGDKGKDKDKPGDTGDKDKPGDSKDKPGDKADTPKDKPDDKPDASKDKDAPKDKGKDADDESAK